jgi:hypothetical protein
MHFKDPARQLRSLRACHLFADQKPLIRTHESRAYIPELSETLERDPNLCDGARRCGRMVGAYTYRRDRDGRTAPGVVIQAINSSGDRVLCKRRRTASTNTPFSISVRSGEAAAFRLEVSSNAGLPSVMRRIFWSDGGIEVKIVVRNVVTINRGEFNLLQTQRVPGVLRIPLSRHIFNYFRSNKSVRKSVSRNERQADDFFVRLTQIAFRRCSIPHRGSNVDVPHEPSLHSERRTDVIEPGPKRVAKAVRTDVTDASLCGLPSEVLATLQNRRIVSIRYARISRRVGPWNGRTDDFPEIGSSTSPSTAAAAPR